MFPPSGAQTISIASTPDHLSWNAKRKQSYRLKSRCTGLENSWNARQMAPRAGSNSGSYEKRRRNLFTHVKRFILK